MEDKQSTNTFNNRFKNWLDNNLLLLATIAGVMFGTTIGFGLRPFEPADSWIQILSYPGELFMRLLKMIIIPLIISSLVAGSASLNARMNGRIALRTFTYFLVTSVTNAILGIILAVTIHPGDPRLRQVVKQNSSDKQSAAMLDSFLDLGRNIISDNIFQATFQQAYTLYKNETVQVYNTVNKSFEELLVSVPEVQYRSGINTLGIVFFCLVFGTLLGSLGEKSKPVVNFFAVIFEVVMKLVTGAMWITPLGICSIIVGKILSVPDIASVISQLAWFIITVVLGVFIYQLTILQAIYFVFLRKNPFKFYAALTQGTLTAFATASTAAALPATFRIMSDKLKADSRIIRFVLPIGCNINMDGTALFVAIAAIFIAQMNNKVLTIGDLVTVCFTSTAASFSSASVPSAALVLLLMVLSSIDTRVDDVALLFAVDWIVDRFRTTNNMLGDCYAAAVVEKLSKKELVACEEDIEITEKCFSDENMLPMLPQNGSNFDEIENNALLKNANLV